MVPVGHVVHVLIEVTPNSVLYFPLAQSVQRLLALNPDVELHFPRKQGLQLSSSGVPLLPGTNLNTSPSNTKDPSFTLVAVPAANFPAGQSEQSEASVEAVSSLYKPALQAKHPVINTP